MLALGYFFASLLLVGNLVASSAISKAASPVVHISRQVIQSGQGSFYDPGLGACGVTIAEFDLAVAISHILYDSYPGYTGNNPNDNPVCGKLITAYYMENQVTVRVLDRCTSCQIDDLDFTPTAFEALANFDLGRIPMTWVWDS